MIEPVSATIIIQVFIAVFGLGLPLLERVPVIRPFFGSPNFEYAVHSDCIDKHYILKKEDMECQPLISS